MSDRALEKYVSPKLAAAKPNADEDMPEDLGSFGLLRGVHERAVSLELRLKDSSIEAFTYAYLSHARFDPSCGIELHFGGKVVKIVGRNLGCSVRSSMTLFGAIVRHRVPWIAEADEPTALRADREALVIDEIKVK